MSSRSIVDRVLLFAAAICAAGLVWQLTVLMTTKGRAPSFRSVETVSSASAEPASVAPSPTPPMSQPTPSASTIRVVYADANTPKAIGKATDTLDGMPAPLASSSSLSGGAALPVSSATAFAPAPSARVAPSGLMAPPATASAPLDATDQQPASAEEAQAPAATPAPAKVAALDPKPQTAPVETTDAKTTNSGGLNINDASVDALNHLRGGGHIGQAIASHRPYHSVEELLKKRVIKRSVYEQIKNQLAAE